MNSLVKWRTHSTRRRKKTKKSIRKIASEVGGTFGTVRNVLKKDLRFFPKHPQKQMKMTEDHRKDRKIKAKKLLSDYEGKWKFFMCTDWSAPLPLNPDPNPKNEVQWLPRNQPAEPYPKEKFDPRVICWGGITSKGLLVYDVDFFSQRVHCCHWGPFRLLTHFIREDITAHSVFQFVRSCDRAVSAALATGWC